MFMEPHKRYADNTFGSGVGGTSVAGHTVDALSRTTMSQQIADRLTTAIAIGAYTPGDRLPAERQFAEQLGVSRVTIRQAMKIMIDRGLVTVRRGRGGGTSVTELSLSSIAQTARSTLERELPKLEELCEFRCLIEGTIARTAAERLTTHDSRTLRSLLDEFLDAKDLSTARSADSRLHHHISLMSKNQRLVSFAQQLGVEATLGFGSEPYPEHFLQRATEEHIVLVDRIVSGDTEGSFRAAKDHFALTFEVMQEYLESCKL